MTLIGFVIDSFFMFDAKFFKRKEIERSVFQSNEKSNKNLFDLSFLWKRTENPHNSPTSCQDMVGNIIAHYYITSVKS